MWAISISDPRPRTDTDADADAPSSSQSSPSSMRTYIARRPSSHAAPSCLPLVSARLSIFRSPYPARSLVSLDRSELEPTLTAVHRSLHRRIALLQGEAAHPRHGRALRQGRRGQRCHRRMEDGRDVPGVRPLERVQPARAPLGGGPRVVLHGHCLPVSLRVP